MRGQDKSHAFALATETCRAIRSNLYRMIEVAADEGGGGELEGFLLGLRFAVEETRRIEGELAGLSAVSA